VAPATALSCMSSHFNHPAYRERFGGKGHAALCAYRRQDADHGHWVTAPMKPAAEVLHGSYLGDVCVSVYQKAKVKEMRKVIAACRELGANAVRLRQEQKVC